MPSSLRSRRSSVSSSGPRMSWLMKSSRYSARCSDSSHAATSSLPHWSMLRRHNASACRPSWQRAAVTDSIRFVSPFHFKWTNWKCFFLFSIKRDHWSGNSFQVAVALTRCLRSNCTCSPFGKNVLRLTSLMDSTSVFLIFHQKRSLKWQFFPSCSGANTRSNCTCSSYGKKCTSIDVLE